MVLLSLLCDDLFVFWIYAGFWAAHGAVDVYFLLDMMLRLIDFLVLADSLLTTLLGHTCDFRLAPFVGTNYFQYYDMWENFAASPVSSIWMRAGYLVLTLHVLFSP